jgi:hypothetical protein
VTDQYVALQSARQQAEPSKHLPKKELRCASISISISARRNDRRAPNPVNPARNARAEFAVRMVSAADATGNHTTIALRADKPVSRLFNVCKTCVWILKPCVGCSACARLGPEHATSKTHAERVETFGQTSPDRVCARAAPG